MSKWVSALYIHFIIYTVYYTESIPSWDYKSSRLFFVEKEKVFQMRAPSYAQSLFWIATNHLKKREDLKHCLSDRLSSYLSILMIAFISSK